MSVPTSSNVLWQSNGVFSFKNWDEEEVVVFHQVDMATHLLTKTSFSILKILADTSVPMSVSDITDAFGNGLLEIEEQLLPIFEHHLIELQKIHLVEKVS
jgi:DNA-binding transcriptional ArsR family regulator